MNTSDSTSDTPVGHRRRRWMMAAAGLGAAAVGMGLALRHFALEEVDTSNVWTHSFSTPDGGTLSFADLKGQPLILNFWATWCPPCIEEMPLLSDFYTKIRTEGWEMLGLAVDEPGPVARFLTQRPVSYPVAMAGFPGVELSKQLGNTTGSLPFTVVFGADGGVRHRKLGRVYEADLLTWLG